MKKEPIPGLQLLLVFLLACVIGIGGCKKEHDDEPPPGEETLDPIIPETTKAISTEDCEAFLVSIDTTDMSFTFNSDILDKYPIEVGDVIIVPVDRGYLRKVTAIEGQKDKGFIKIITILAKMGEAIRQGQMDFNYPIDTVISITEIVEQSGNTTLKVEGNLTLGATLYGTLKMKDWSLHKFDINSDITETFVLTGTCTYNNLTQGWEKKGFDHRFPSRTFMVGSVPVVVTPVLKIYIGDSCVVKSQVSSSITQVCTLTTGMTYQDGNWTIRNPELKPDLTASPPTCSAKADLQVWVKPQLTFEFYGLTGPYINDRVYLQLEANTLEDPWWRLNYGMDFAMGIDMEFFDMDNWEMDFYHMKETILQADGPFGNSSLADSVKSARKFSTGYKVWYEQQDHEIKYWLGYDETYFGNDYVSGGSIGVHTDSIKWNGNQFDMIISFSLEDFDTNYYSVSGKLAPDGKSLVDVVFRNNYIYNTVQNDFTHHKTNETTFELEQIPLEEVSGKTIKFKTTDPGDFQSISHYWYYKVLNNGEPHEERWITNVSTLPLPDKESYIFIWFMVD